MCLLSREISALGVVEHEPVRTASRHREVARRGGTATRRSAALQAECGEQGQPPPQKHRQKSRWARAPAETPSGAQKRGRVAQRAGGSGVHGAHEEAAADGVVCDVARTCVEIWICVRGGAQGERRIASEERRKRPVDTSIVGAYRTVFRRFHGPSNVIATQQTKHDHLR